MLETYVLINRLVDRWTKPRDKQTDRQTTEGHRQIDRQMKRRREKKNDDRRRAIIAAKKTGNQTSMATNGV